METDTEGESAVQRPTQRETETVQKDAGSGPQPQVSADSQHQLLFLGQVTVTSADT